MATKKTASANQPDTYLGLLYPTEDYKVYLSFLTVFRGALACLTMRSYGYLTNTKIKFIVVVDDSYVDMKEAELRTVRRSAVQPSLTFSAVLQAVPRSLHRDGDESVLRPG